MSYKVEYLARNLFGEKGWASALLRFATIAEARAWHEHNELSLLVAATSGSRVVESSDPVNAVWDYEQGRYSPVGEALR